MSRVRVISSLAVACFFMWPQVAKTETNNWSELTTAPRDSADARNLRIWLPVRHAHSCRVRIDIFDNEGRKLRQLFSGGLTSGYYNLYWDKRDDSGKWVPEGLYDCRIEDCGEQSSESLKVEFKVWERQSQLVGSVNKDSLATSLDLFRDSAMVSLIVLNHRGDTVAVPVEDSLLHMGRHKLVWAPIAGVGRGAYGLVILVGDYSYHRRVRIR